MSVKIESVINLPVPIEAVRVTEENANEVCLMALSRGLVVRLGDRAIGIEGLRNESANNCGWAFFGDWILFGAVPLAMDHERFVERYAPADCYRAPVKAIE